MYQSHRLQAGCRSTGLLQFEGLGLLILAIVIWPIAACRAFAEAYDVNDSLVSILTEDPMGNILASDHHTTNLAITDGAPADGQVLSQPVFNEMCFPEHDSCDQWRLGDYLSRLRRANNACWIGRVDALIMWRNAPPNRPLIDTANTALPILNASQLESSVAAGPRVSLFREHYCTGSAWETTYLRVANFRSQRSLTTPQYALAPPGIYHNSNLQPFDTGTTNLGSMIQGFEINHYRSGGENFRFLAGFRWLEWQEQFTLMDQVTSVSPTISDLYQTRCVNDLYGGQIGADVRIASFSWLRIDSVVKAGAYYNNAVQSSVYTTNDSANAGTAAITIGQSPASCGFVGEVGITGVIPITSCLDIRIGYLGLWLSGIAQPTQQLSGQSLTPGVAAAGTLSTNGGVLVQGLNIGLEGRW